MTEPTNNFRRRPVRDMAAWRVIELCVVSAALAPAAVAQTVSGGASAPVPPPKPAKPERITVTGNASPKPGLKFPGKLQSVPQSIDLVSQAAMKEQAATSVTDALRYAPGITLNSGEGGAHGDNVNLRGFSAIDSFYIDGIRDPGSYTRDNFAVDSLEVLQGPASVLFGNGSPGGIVNQTSKLPSLTEHREIGIEGGTNDEGRATIDINEPIGPNAAVRLNAMGETTGVADRDYVQQRRWGVAPSLALGLNTPTTFTLSYFHQEEDNIPDYGIPFLWGQPAPVNRSLYYGLKNYDKTQTDVDIVTAALRHDVTDDISVTNTLRYARYWSNYRVSAPHFGDDYTGGAPAPGTSLADILVYRDRPSSEGTQTLLTDHTDLSAHFETGPFTHNVVTGFEIGRQTSNFVRFDNGNEGIDGVAPTPLLAPDADETAPSQNTIVNRPNAASGEYGIYATDQIHLTTTVSLDLGVRFDLYDTSFSDVLAGTGFHRTDRAVSPKAALVYEPTPNQTYYFSYTTSFDPAVSYLTLAADNSGPEPETAKTYELGTKQRWLDNKLTSTAALFRIDSAHVTVSDPDDPTLQEMPGTNQRVQGVEFTTTGDITSSIDITLNYMFLDPEISASSMPAEVGKQVPNAARNVANLWVLYEPSEEWQAGTGLNYVGHRYADTLNTANIPGFVVWNAMGAWQVDPRVHLQLNVQNITDAKYFTGAYYSDATESHVLPGQGRVFTLGARFGF